MAKRIALVTGTLAEASLREVAQELRLSFDLDVTVVVLNIQVAALMTVDWLLRKLPDDISAYDRVILTGYVRGDVERLGAAVEIGPKDVRDLPEMFGAASGVRDDYGAHTIDIIAEVNHAATLELNDIFHMADALRTAGADVIDIGCEPAADRDAWAGVGDVVRELKARGHRVSVDSFHTQEVAAACAAGAELVLSVNSTNCAAACDWGAEVVAIPDDPREIDTIESTVQMLEKHSVCYRIDPIIEPIGCGFAASLGRYLEVRKRYPQAAMMMGVGNLSEMTQVDSAGVNMLLVGFCQEVGIASVLTTQVINWARSSVAELDAARQMCFHAAKHGMPPKHLDGRLVMLRDEKVYVRDRAALDKLAAQLTDRNYRIFAEEGVVHVISRDVHVQGDDVFALFQQLSASGVDASHAFYLGYEMAKAVTAMTLGKQYTQDEALNWGMLTRPENGAAAHGGKV